MQNNWSLVLKITGVILLVVVAGCVANDGRTPDSQNWGLGNKSEVPSSRVVPTQSSTPGAYDGSLKTFSSNDELIAFLERNQAVSSYSNYGGRGGVKMLAASESMNAVAQTPRAVSAPASPDYSTTNVQVQGVDEGDIVKTDGNYLYVISQNQVFITSTGDNAKVQSFISFAGQPSELYIEGSKLVVLGNRYDQQYNYDGDLNWKVLADSATDKPSAVSGIIAEPRTVRPWQPRTFVEVYDIKDRTNPVRVKDIRIEGSLGGSRLVEGIAYAVVTNYIYLQDDIVPLPRLLIDKAESVIKAEEVRYIDSPDENYVLTTIVSLDLKSLLSQRTAYLLGGSQTLYVSENNLYSARAEWVDDSMFVEEYAQMIRPALSGAGAKEVDIIMASVGTKRDLYQRVFEVVQWDVWGYGVDSAYAKAYVEVLLQVLPQDLAPHIERISSSSVTAGEKVQALSNLVEVVKASLSSAERRAWSSELRQKLAVVEKAAQARRNSAQADREERRPTFDRLNQKWSEVMSSRRENTAIYKFSLSKGSVSFVATGKVPGSLLNQFSMDENNGYFRVATSAAQWSRDTSTNAVYVLDAKMKQVGSVTGLAKGERIYAVRFMSDRAFVVTFRQTDPLFALDMSNPKDPRVVGELKIPGFSQYLHPYGDNMLIGVGQDADEKTGRARGLKLALFDISDINNPIQEASYTFGEGSSSEALNDHKAFLFSKEKNLLVIPVSIWNNNYCPPGAACLLAEDRSFNGAYAFKVTPGGWSVLGKIQHSDNANSKYGYTPQVRRSLYIGNTLYTISEREVRAHDLDGFDLVAKVVLEQKLDNEIQSEAKKCEKQGGKWFIEGGPNMPPGVCIMPVDDTLPVSSPTPRSDDEWSTDV